MLAARRWLVANRRRVATTIVAETGKPWEDAFNVELVYVADALGFWARRARHYLRDERVRGHSPFTLGRRMTIRRRPRGVVGVIGPWNYPLILCFGDAIPALMAGNAAVLKPSELTPLSTLVMAEGMRAAGLPADVMPVVNGGRETAEALIDAADMIQFTGSTTTGKKVMARAAETLTPVSLELGGKDPMIVLADADIERAATAAAWYGLCNAGQSCWAVERIYVEDAAHDAFVGALADRVRGR
jgi:acyl-CoA reductase-like NAD-dependent aldehyde dehydrogenase